MLGVFSLAEKALSMKCHNGFAFHMKTAPKDYQEKMTSCGVSDIVQEVECPDTNYCKTYDFWLKGITAKPMTFKQCGEEGDKIEETETKCKAVCDKTKIENDATELKAKLKRKFPTITDECLNTLTSISTKSKSYCMDGDNCNKDKYCPDIKVSQKCEWYVPPSNTKATKTTNGTQKPKPPKATKKPNGEKTHATKTTKAVNGTQKPNGENTPAANTTGNATASAGTMIADEFMGMNKFAISFLINAFLGTWVIIAFFF